MIKAVFFDVDGTLFSHNSRQVPESTRRAIAKLKEKGIKVCLATGRHMLEIEDLSVKDISFDGYIMQNGQVCQDAEKRMLFGFPMEPYTVNKFVQLFEEKKVPVLFMEADSFYVNYVDDLMQQVQKDISSPIPPIRSYGGGNLYHVCVYGDDPTTLAVAKEFPECKVARWHPRAVEFIDGAGGKMSGIKKYMEIIGVTQDEIMAFGDGENDIEMLQFAKIGVAMGNGVEAAKAAADYVTSDVDEGGVEQALRFWRIIE